MAKTNKKENKYDQLRHSTAHLLAAAVTDIWPNAMHTIGPAIENGFYYDFDFGDTSISDADLSKIEEKMRDLANKWDKFEEIEVDSKQAKDKFKNNPYKAEMIDDLEKQGEKITMYRSGDFVDLCRGDHIDNPDKQLKHFKLLSIAGAYWRGDEKNKMLTRIYGTAFPSEKELEEHLNALEEAKQRDHRKIGKELGLFVFSDLVGKGLPLFTEKGSAIRRELERFIVDEEIKRGYKHVYTPEIANVELYEKSGHYPYYKDSMYPLMKVDNERLILRPMTCPHHFQLFSSRPRSYKELPVRYAELAKQFRYEKSGELTGLMRVRLFCLADAHIICKKDQAENEIDGVLDLIDFVANTLGLKLKQHYHYRLSKGDPNNKDKFFKDDDAWSFAEDVLRNTLIKRNAPFYEAEGEAAFYGPKIDVQMTNVSGKEETAFTVQYDFVMPKRFNLAYIDESGEEKEAVVIHRSSIGAIERVLALLIEHYAGNFPTWLSPVQVRVLPITDRNLNYANNIVDRLKENNIRVELDERSETLGAKIRDAQKEKVAYMLIIGDKEEKENTVSVRQRSGKDHGQQKPEYFIENIEKEITQKTIN